MFFFQEILQNELDEIELKNTELISSLEKYKMNSTFDESTNLIVENKSNLEIRNSIRNSINYNISKEIKLKSFLIKLFIKDLNNEDGENGEEHDSEYEKTIISYLDFLEKHVNFIILNFSLKYKYCRVWS